MVAATVAIFIGMDTFNLRKAFATLLIFTGVGFVTQSKSHRRTVYRDNNIPGSDESTGTKP